VLLSALPAYRLEIHARVLAAHGLHHRIEHISASGSGAAVAVRARQRVGPLGNLAPKVVEARDGRLAALPLLEQLRVEARHTA
jgi:hypothetical protein